MIINSLQSGVPCRAVDGDALDRPVRILGMLMNGVRPVEVAEALDMTDQWLAIRRWAILKRVVGSRRPSQPRAARGLLNG
jgi:hypothetical protein